MAEILKNTMELQPYRGDEPFVFISYSREDIVQVEGVLRVLQRAGIRFWYDQGIPGGRSWHDLVMERLKSCSMFLCFLANGVEQRRHVLDEIEEAIQRGKREDDFRVLFIFLEKMPAKVFGNVGKPEIEDYIKKTQYIRYKGMTQKFISDLYAEGVFSDALVKGDLLKEWQNRDKQPLELDPSELFPESKYICETEFPEKKEGTNIYKVKTEEMDPDAVCLICIDNQWCPPDVYNDPEFWRDGLHWKQGEKTRTKYQTNELFRALLHHRQIVINRAYLYNSHVFEQWYDPESNDCKAFKQLLSDGSFLIYLTTETQPYDESKPPRFATERALYRAWGDICNDKETDIFCVRMDWPEMDEDGSIDDTTNKLKVDQLLFHKFENFCLTMAENHHLQDDLSDAYGFDEKQRKDFDRVWRDVQVHAAARDRIEHPYYTRERFYQKFIVKKGTDVSDGVMDIQKAFAPELKEIADLQYGMNLPEALGIRAIFPIHGNLKDFYRSGQMLEHQAKVVSKAEIVCAIVNFSAEFLRNNQQVDYPQIMDISLDEIVLLRGLPEWKQYIRSVANGTKRAHLREVDYADISFVWVRFYEWMHAAKEFEETWAKSGNKITWQSIEGSVSIIYRLGSQEIITVYHAKSNKVTIRTSIDQDGVIPTELDHPVLLTIDYVCADILEYDMKNDFMLSEQRLFEGMTREKLSDVWKEIITQLHNMNSARQIDLVWKQKTQKEKKFAHKYREKAESIEWRSYVELLSNTEDRTIGIIEDELLPQRIIEKAQADEWRWYTYLKEDRPKEFKQDQDAMLKIITDLDEVCKYELRNENVNIGVQYRSKYSILVVDLVKNSKGEIFPYERVMPAVKDGAAVVCIPIYDDKYVLIEQFRHSMRGYQLAFPRGYGEPGLTGEENAEKEILEELNAEILSIECVGGVVADSGMNGNHVEVYCCQITSPSLNEGYEGIYSIMLLSLEEIQNMAHNGEINDGYTLSAIELLQSRAEHDSK